MPASNLSTKLARETLPLLQDIRRSFMLTHPNSTPTDAAAIGYAIYLVECFKRQGGTILWNYLMSADFDSTRLNLPPVFPCNARYATSITRAIVPTLDSFIDVELHPRFKGKVYRNFGIRAALRAAYCLTHEGFNDVCRLPAGIDPAPSAPAYDPFELLFPNGTNAPDALGDDLDSDIFDRAECASIADEFWSSVELTGNQTTRLC